MVVGDLIGTGSAQEQAVVGETPNLAARLQGIGEPNTVVIADDTRRLLGNLFELKDLGAKDLKGIADPVRAWAVLRPASVESRFEALHASALTELVGREEELELLLRRLSRAKTGEGQVVLLSGEAGIGKSRLTAALMERLASKPHALALFLLPAAHRQRPLSGHRPDGARRGNDPKIAEGQSNPDVRNYPEPAPGRASGETKHLWPRPDVLPGAGAIRMGLAHLAAQTALAAFLLAAAGLCCRA